MIQFSSDKGIDLLGRSITDRTLIRTSWILPLVSVLLATVIHYMSGNYRDIPFFISETDHSGIEDHVFSIGLFCSAMIQLLVSIRLYVLFKPIASPKLHHIALACGIATSTHLSVLAFVTMDQNIEVPFTPPLLYSMVALHGPLPPISHFQSPIQKEGLFEFIHFLLHLYPYS